MPTFEFSSEIAGAPKENLFDNLGAKIRVIGVGGAGGNAVDNMIDKSLEGVEFVVANTDAQALQQSGAPAKIQLILRKVLVLEEILSLEMSVLRLIKMI